MALVPESDPPPAGPSGLGHRRCRDCHSGIEGSLSYARDSFSTPELSDLLCRKTKISHVFSRGCCSAHASTWPLLGLIWPKTGCASIA